MIAFPRSLARQFRLLLRRCATPANMRQEPVVIVRASEVGLRLESVLSEVAVSLEHPGNYATGIIAFRASLLAQLESTCHDQVRLEIGKGHQCRASWTEDQQIRNLEFEAIEVEDRHCFPALPSRMVAADAGLLVALEEASQTAARQLSGRGVHRVLLRGKRGQVIGTDGHHLLIHSGLRLPWREDLLIPRLEVWGLHEPFGFPVMVGRTDAQIFIRMGEVQLALQVDRDSRFPAVDGVIPEPGSVTTTLRLHDEALHQLKQQLPRAPNSRDSHASVTLSVGKDVTVEMHTEDGERTGTFPLSGVEVTGKPVCVAMKCSHLARAIKLGFACLEIVSPQQPLCCRDDTRTLVWMPLTEPTRATQPPVPRPTVPASSEKENPTVPEPNGKHTGNGDAGNSVLDPLTEGEAIRNLLGEAQSRLAHLIGMLKQFRKQSRAVRAAVQSLQQLPPLAP